MYVIDGVVLRAVILNNALISCMCPSLYDELTHFYLCCFRDLKENEEAQAPQDRKENQ